MSTNINVLAQLMELGVLSPLSGHFGRFIARQSGMPEDSLLVLTAALLSQGNQKGDVCLDLRRHAGQPLFAGATADSNILLAPSLEKWQAELVIHEITRIRKFENLLLNERLTQ